MNDNVIHSVTEGRSNANGYQVGGSHYKELRIEPWDIIEANGLDFWKGNALKYLLRNKNGVEDLRKAIHYIQKAIEIETAAPNTKARP